MAKHPQRTARYRQNEVVCPVCGKPRDTRQTVLWDWYRNYYRPGFAETTAHPLPKEFEKIAEGFNQIHQLDKNEKWYHMYQWACHRCIHEGRAIAGDYTRQYFGLGGPILAYTNLERNCRRCGKAFVFSASEQQYWYETLQFLVDSVPNECPACRAILRREKQLHQRLGELAKSAKPTIAELQERYEIYVALGMTEKAETVQRQLTNKTKRTGL